MQADRSLLTFLILFLLLVMTACVDNSEGGSGKNSTASTDGNNSTEDGESENGGSSTENATPNKAKLKTFSFRVKDNKIF